MPKKLWYLMKQYTRTIRRNIQIKILLVKIAVLKSWISYKPNSLVVKYCSKNLCDT